MENEEKKQYDGATDGGNSPDPRDEDENYHTKVNRT